MTDLVQFPIPTKVLDPAEYPAFKGDPGEQGPPGNDGAPGLPGADGKTILSGSGAPDSALGADGDYYLDITATLIYGPKAAGTWPAGVLLKGEDGADGVDGQDGTSVQLKGSVATVEDLPDGATAGDLWVVLADGNGYVSDGADGWESVGPIRGPAGADGQDGAPGSNGTDGEDGAPGADGKTILSGSGTPASGTGTDGDYYLDIAATLLYGPKAAGAWPEGVLLKGADGTDGEAGADADLTPIPEYTETGATLTFIAEASGDIEIPGDGKVYALTITGDCSLVTGTWPTAPECANVTVAIEIDAAVAPVIALDAAWHWADSAVTAIPTTDGARCILQLASYPQGWIEASVREIGVPA